MKWMKSKLILKHNINEKGANREILIEVSQSESQKNRKKKRSKRNRRSKRNKRRRKNTKGIAHHLLRVEAIEITIMKDQEIRDKDMTVRYLLKKIAIEARGIMSEEDMIDLIIITFK